MSKNVDQNDAHAKRAANGTSGLGGARDRIYMLAKDDFKSTPNSIRENFEKIKSDIHDEIAATMEDINASRIRTADRRIRRIKETLNSMISDEAEPRAKFTSIIARLNTASKLMREITSVAVEGSKRNNDNHSYSIHLSSKGVSSKLKREISPDAKSYYQSYVAHDLVLPLNERLVEDILSYNPTSVLEFGCGVGRNLALLKNRIAHHLGIDISAKAIEIAAKKGLNVIWGDESKLKNIGNYDVAFTCSVLDHIEGIDDIVNDLKRIANIAIVLAETNTEVGRFYYPHDYESLGFVRTDYAYTSTQARKEAVYYIWHYKIK